MINIQHHHLQWLPALHKGKTEKPNSPSENKISWEKLGHGQAAAEDILPADVVSFEWQCWIVLIAQGCQIREKNKVDFNTNNISVLFGFDKLSYD